MTNFYFALTTENLTLTAERWLKATNILSVAESSFSNYYKVHIWFTYYYNTIPNNSVGESG